MEVRQLDRHSDIQETKRQDYLNAHCGLSGGKQDVGVDNLDNRAGRETKVKARQKWKLVKNIKQEEC